MARNFFMRSLFDDSRMKHHPPLIALAALALTFAGCSKPAPAAAAPHFKVPNLGVVEVSDGIQSRHDLGGGRICLVTPTVQKDGTLLLALRIEEAGRLLSAPSVVTKSDRAFEVSAGEVGVGFTPHLRQ